MGFFPLKTHRPGSSGTFGSELKNMDNLVHHLTINGQHYNRPINPITSRIHSADRIVLHMPHQTSISTGSIGGFSNNAHSINLTNPQRSCCPDKACVKISPAHISTSWKWLNMSANFLLFCFLLSRPLAHLDMQLISKWVVSL